MANNYTRLFSILPVVGLLIPGILFIACGNPPEEKPPNIVIIYADDLGFGDIAHYHPGSKIPTPNIDQLASEGLTFTDAHSAAAVCTPSRYALLTGKYPFRSRLKEGVLWAYDRPLLSPVSDTTLPEFLKTRGYTTALIGKWHLGFEWPMDTVIREADWEKMDVDTRESLIDFTQPPGGGPNSLGFDYFFGMDTPNFPPYAFLENGAIVGTQPVRPDSFQLPGGVPGVQQPDWDIYKILPTLREKTHWYLSRRASEPAPFFLFLSLTAPHTPIAPAQPFSGKSDAGDYGDFVVQIDDLVGAVVAQLEELGMRKNTLLVFTSDNGSPKHAFQGAAPGTIEAAYGHDPGGPWRGMKGDSWEGGHRVPFIVSWKGQVEEGTASAQLTCQTDLMATFYELLNEPVPAGIRSDSYSLLPVLRNPVSATRRTSIVHQASSGELSIRHDGWKLILGKGSGGMTAWIDPEDGKHNPWPAQLYNLNEDPNETHNLYGDTSQTATIQRLKNILVTLDAPVPSQDDHQEKEKIQ